MKTTIQKWGNSQGIRIPKSMLNTLNWKENEQVMIKVQEEKIIIEKTKNKKNIKQLFEDYNGKYTIEDINWGKPVGEEIW